MTRRPAFTLVEIMISVAIIALLIGILVPALSYMSGRAEDAVCRSHLHEIAQCFHLYAAANRGRAPDENSTVSWDEQLRPYAPNTEIFLCPADTGLSGDDVGLSYSWRHSMEAPRSGIRRLQRARGDAILLFDFQSGWHRQTFFNVSLVDTSAHSYSDLQFLDDLDRAAE